MPNFDPNLLVGFKMAADSLKLYRRTDLRDPNQGTALIDELYVDPLPHNALFQTVLRPSTTFVIGRKGTGKSTIFERLQSELRQTKHLTSAYVDIKTVFESSQVDPGLLERVSATTNALPREEIERLLLYKEFLRAVVQEVKIELRKRVESSLWARVKESITGTVSDLLEGLDSVLEDADEARFISALGLRIDEIRTKASRSDETANKASVGLVAGANPALTIGAEHQQRNSDARERENHFNDVLVRTINIKELITRIKEVLEALGIRHLYVLLDDFSELPKEAMQVVVNVLLAPLNNWSDEFIKFKIAAYPGRIYFGEIDKTKIDEVFLDLYTLYGGGDVSRMEESAIDFTRRLVTARIRHFCSVDPAHFFERDEEDVWKTLFFASMANPRILGNLLHSIYESHLIRGRGIGIRAIQEAAERYYVEKIESYFHLGKFLQESFGERASIFSLKELLENIVARARDLRNHESEVTKKLNGRHPTSHFHVQVYYEHLFSTLELNFFVTKYFEMTDRSSRKVSVFALNYGLCSKYDIRFGRPVGEREFRLYLVERFLDYSSLLLAYLSKNQEITCVSCSSKFSYEQLSAIQMFGMLCPNCKSGQVQVKNLSRKYEAELEAVNRDLLLPSTELGILQTLAVEREPMRAASIAGDWTALTNSLVVEENIWLSGDWLTDSRMTPDIACFRLQMSQKVLILAEIKTNST